MAAGRHTFTIEQGATFQRTITYADATGSAIDLTNYQARMQIRPSAGSSTLHASLTTTASADGSGLVVTPVSGSIAVTLTAYSSSLLSFNEAYYDLEIYSGSGDSTYVIRLLEGKVKLTKEVTV